MNQLVRVRELARWSFDYYPYRPQSLHTKSAEPTHLIETNVHFDQGTVILTQQTADFQETFAPHAARADLLDEMTGLSWSLGVVDLRSLLAFQRRLAFDPAMPQFHIPARQDWAALIALSFGPAKLIDCKIDHNYLSHTMTVQSTNPNLHFRTGDDATLPVTIHAGGPFLEVAQFRDRWFLRDGYHRAYALLQAGIFEVPAVLVETKTIEQLGAAEPWFFSEQVLFSNDPPRVVDFLNEECVVEYHRPPLIKTLRLIMTETLTPANISGEQA